MRYWPVLFVVLTSAGCASVVSPGQAGLWFRPSGDPSNEVLDEGRYWHFPSSRLYVYDLRWAAHEEKVHAQTRDRIHVTVRISVTTRPARAALPKLHRGVGPAYYTSIVQPLIHKEIREHFSLVIFEAVGTEMTPMQNSIGKKMGEQLLPIGIELGPLAIEDVDYPEQLRQALEARTVLEQRGRNAEAQRALAEKEAAIGVAKANAEGETAIVTKQHELEIAKKEAEIALVRARANLEALNLQRVALTPLYLKLRMIEAIEALAKSPTSKVYVIPTGKDGVPLMHIDER